MKNTVGIIMAGGKGSRLMPLTASISKHLLPIYDKPMIFYALSTLMIARIKRILIIGSNKDIEHYKSFLFDGSKYGLRITYAAQNEPKGIPEAFTLGKKFISNSNVCLILGDNFFYGNGLSSILMKIKKNNKIGATVIGFKVKHSSNYGVAKIVNKKITKIYEKPKKFISDIALAGLYFYDNKVVDYVKQIKPSKRKELEITDINNLYLKNKSLKIEILKRGFTWLDTGTPEDLLKAAQFVNITEERQGIKIACIEEIAFRNKWISKKNLIKLSKEYGSNDYGNYLKNLI